MCGIVGILGTQDRSADLTREELHRMASRLQHRGPDGAGYILAEQGQIGLAQTRLSIMDLEGGRQPLINEDGSLQLVANGEIYDYEIWRQMLEARGHRFATRSDSEVILHLYEEFGIDCIKQLNGEFAFILWDQKKKKLFAGRDVFGVKPLFYTHCESTLFLASEIKALFAAKSVPRAMNPSYFIGPMMGAMSPGLTPFASIFAIKPGHYIEASTGTPPKEILYYEPSFQTQSDLGFDEAKTTCRKLLEKAVSRRLQADVPVHVYLSGGVDSTGIAALLKHLGHTPKAYSIGFPSSEMDESNTIRSTAQTLGLEFDLITCTQDRLADKLLATIWATEAPIGNLNSVAKYLLAQHVHQQGVRVCLTGEGSDELFCGYANWKLEAILRLEQGDAADQREARRLWKMLIEKEGRNEGIMWNRSATKQAAKTKSYYGFPSSYRMNAERLDRLVPRLISSDFLQRESRSPSKMMAESFPKERFAQWEPINVTRFLALASLSGYIIPNLGDRVEMAHSLECRTPFMDLDLLHFLETVPAHHLLKMETLREKHLLYESLADILPQSVYQGTKHPFLSPSWRDFAKTASGRELLHTFLNPREIEAAGIFNPATVQMMQALWQRLPARSSLRKSLDLGIGVILSSQILYRLFILDPPQTRPIENFVERRDQHWPRMEVKTRAALASELPSTIIPKTLPPTTLSEWQGFVLRHQKFGNLSFHFVSSLAFFVSPIVAIMTSNVLWLGFFAMSGLMGTAGHFLCKDGSVSAREATFQLSVPYFVLKMFWEILIGRYGRTTQDALAKQKSLQGMQHQPF